MAKFKNVKTIKMEDWVINGIHSVCGLIFEVQKELIDIINEVYEYHYCDAPDEEKKQFNYELYYPSLFDGCMIGEPVYDANTDTFICILEILDLTNDETRRGGVIGQLPKIWITDALSDSERKDKIRFHMLVKLKDFMEVLDKESAPDNDIYNSIMKDIFAKLFDAGNMSNIYNLEVVSRLISLYNDSYYHRIDESEEYSIGNIYDQVTGTLAIGGLYNIGKHLVRCIKIPDYEYYDIIKSGDKFIVIEKLTGDDENGDKTDTILEVSSDLYLKSDEEIIEYFISQRLSELDAFINSTLSRFSSKLDEYKPNHCDFGNIKRIFGINIE